MTCADAPSDLVELGGCTALVTGGAKRLGGAISRALAKQGVQVVVHYNTSADEAAAVVRDIEQGGGRACALGADLSAPEDAPALIDRAIAEAGSLDFLINSASVFPEQSLSGLDPGEVHRVLGVNALSPFMLARRFAEQGRAGAVVNMLDTMIADYDRKHVPYHLSKRMLFSLTRMMAVEFAPFVRVNAVAPGLVLPPEGEDLEYLERLASTNPLGRYGNPAGVAEAAVFLLRSGFVTGQTIFVDGGRHLRGSMYG